MEKKSETTASNDNTMLRHQLQLSELRITLLEKALSKMERRMSEMERMWIISGHYLKGVPTVNPISELYRRPQTDPSVGPHQVDSNHKLPNENEKRSK